jgi:hypothetical protein
MTRILQAKSSGFKSGFAKNGGGQHARATGGPGILPVT